MQFRHSNEHCLGMSTEIKSINSKFRIHFFRTEINNAGTHRTMLTRIRIVKISARILAIYISLCSPFCSWSILAAVVDQASNFETKQTFSYATW